jgi:hypothetical protein
MRNFICEASEVANANDRDAYREGKALWAAIQREIFVFNILLLFSSSVDELEREENKKKKRSKRSNKKKNKDKRNFWNTQISTAVSSDPTKVLFLPVERCDSQQCPDSWISLPGQRKVVLVFAYYSVSRLVIFSPEPVRSITKYHKQSSNADSPDRPVR